MRCQPRRALLLLGTRRFRNAYTNGNTCKRASVGAWSAAGWARMGAMHPRDTSNSPDPAYGLPAGQAVRRNPASPRLLPSQSCPGCSEMDWGRGRRDRRPRARPSHASAPGGSVRRSGSGATNCCCKGQARGGAGRWLPGSGGTRRALPALATGLAGRWAPPSLPPVATSRPGNPHPPEAGHAT